MTGAGGFLPEMIKALLERGMDVELSQHLGYERGDPAGNGSGNTLSWTAATRLAWIRGAQAIDTDAVEEVTEPKLQALTAWPTRPTKGSTSYTTSTDLTAR